MKALLQQAIDALEYNLLSLAVGVTYNKTIAAIETLRAELEKPEPEPVAYLAWRDGKPCWDGDDCVCQDAVYPIDFDDDRTSMPVYLALRNNV